MKESILQEGERMRLLERARRSWERTAAFRRDRDRCKRFTYGDQWSDTVDVNGKIITEAEQFQLQGQLPIKNNLIRRLVRNVLGVFRDRYHLPACQARDPREADEARTMQKLMRYNADLNHLDELYARSMEEFLISGLVVHKKWFGRHGGVSDCWTDFVSPENFFMDISSRDVRCRDVSLVGELHDLPFEEVLSTFSHSPEEVLRISAIYGDLREGDTPCRVIEIWRREHPRRWHCHDPLTGRFWKCEEREYEATVGAENRSRAAKGLPEIEARWYVDEEWRWYFMSPSGQMLDEGTSPYRHGGHPYVMKAYPFIDGEIHSFVADIIDQQKFANRLISMYDWMLRATAKGVLLIPEDSMPRDMNLMDVRDEWARHDGVIVYRQNKMGTEPHQVCNSSANVGITDLLDIQMRLMEDISGVNGALQGKLENGSMSGKLYDSQTKNSMSALADILQSFEDFIRMCGEKDARNIAQYYSEEKIRRIAGEGAVLTPTRWFGGTPEDFAM